MIYFSMGKHIVITVKSCDDTRCGPHSLVIQLEFLPFRFCLLFCLLALACLWSCLCFCVGAVTKYYWYYVDGVIMFYWYW